jgi:ATP-dependent DNA ligase
MSVLNKMIIKPMFAKSSTPFDSQKHVFELKWDGSRCIAFVDSKEYKTPEAHAFQEKVRILVEDKEGL